MKKLLIALVFASLAVGCGKEKKKEVPPAPLVPEKLTFAVPAEAMNTPLTDADVENFRASATRDDSADIDLQAVFEQIFVSKYETVGDQNDRQNKWLQESLASKELLNTYETDMKSGFCRLAAVEPKPTEIGGVGQTSHASQQVQLSGNNCVLNGKLNKTMDITLNTLDQAQKTGTLSVSVKEDFDYAYLRGRVNDDVVQMRGLVSLDAPVIIGEKQSSALFNLKVAMDITNLIGENVGLTCKITILAKADGSNVEMKDAKESTMFCKAKVSTLTPTYYISIFSKGEASQYWLNNRQYSKEVWDKMFPDMNPDSIIDSGNAPKSLTVL